MNTLIEKVAFVTGASAGIGHVIAERPAQDGGSVLVSYGKSADKAQFKPVRVPSKIEVLLGKRAGGRHL